MKKALVNTRVSVKLRKSEYRDEWYLYVESYPVFQSGKHTPQRVREYLNRTITTPIWDKSRNARTNAEGKTTYKPKRDLNGVIQCKSQIDQESCIYADKVRSLRQKEYDNAALSVSYTHLFCPRWGGRRGLPADPPAECARRARPRRFPDGGSGRSARRSARPALRLRRSRPGSRCGPPARPANGSGLPAPDG